MAACEGLRRVGTGEGGFRPFRVVPLPLGTSFEATSATKRASADRRACARARAGAQHQLRLHLVVIEQEGHDFFGLKVFASLLQSHSTFVIVVVVAASVVAVAAAVVVVVLVLRRWRSCCCFVVWALRTVWVG